MKNASSAAQFNAFARKYTPAMAAEMKRALAKMRKVVPGAIELVYDNYNGLVVGFGPTERASDAVLSIVAFPRWVTLCFIQGGPELPDPKGLLKGSGKMVRHIRLDSARDLDTPPIRALIRIAVARADPPFDKRARQRVVIKSISAKQRPRRPRP
jgi:hypothetical protein